MLTMIAILLLISCYSITSYHMHHINIKNLIVPKQLIKTNNYYHNYYNNNNMHTTNAMYMKLFAKSDRKITREDEGEYFESEVSKISLFIMQCKHIYTVYIYYC